MLFSRDKLADLLAKDAMTTGDLGEGTRSVEGAGRKKRRKRSKHWMEMYKELSEAAEMMGVTYPDVDHPDIDGPFVKAIDNGEWRYTLGPVYAPDVTDRHQEWATDTEMHKGIMRYQLQTDKRLRLQHNEMKSVGTVLSVFRWPYPVETMMKAGAEERQVTLPPGTTYAEVLWDERPWNELVKTGKIRGFSMGGRAKRVRVAVSEKPHSE